MTVTAGSNMHALAGWRAVTCKDSDGVREVNAPVSPLSSLTDLSGEFGDPVIYTEWGNAAGVPVLRDYRWPFAGCKHYVPEVTA